MLKGERGREIGGERKVERGEMDKKKMWQNSRKMIERWILPSQCMHTSFPQPPPVVRGATFFFTALFGTMSFPHLLR